MLKQQLRDYSFVISATTDQLGPATLKDRIIQLAAAAKSSMLCFTGISLMLLL